MEEITDNVIFNQFQDEQQYLTSLISPITDSDEELFESCLPPPVSNSSKDSRLNFEDSFEYVRMYFNSGGFRGFKLYDNKDLIIFALEKKKKPHFKLFKPLNTQRIQRFSEIITALSSVTEYPIQIVCINNEHLKLLKKDKQLEVKNVKEFKYYIYDLDTLNELRGNQWKTVRQKISTFKRNYPKLKVEPLSSQNYDETKHFIGAWRRELLANRGLSYANIEKNKFAREYYSEKNDFRHIWSTVYRLGTRVVAFQLAYRLGPETAAHAIGLADTNIKGLSEFTQIQIWEQLHNDGIRFINDGPSWRPGLQKYKLKFNPVTSQQVFECKIRSSKFQK
jgi:hypothetical protein